MSQKKESRAPATSWLILSHCFNMDGRAASQVIADKIPHLIGRGITPVVISAAMGRRATQHPHLQAFALGPSALRFDARHLISERIGRGAAYRVMTLIISIVLAPLIIIERVLFGLQNHASWVFSAVFLGLLAIRRYHPRVIFSTGGAYCAHWAAYWLKRLTGVAWIAEVHDPMIFPGHVPKDRNSRRIAKIEALICKHADQAWWLTQGALASAKGRHPELGGRGFWVHGGADTGASQALERSAPVAPDKATFRIRHFGSLSKSRNLDAFAQALGMLLRRQPELRTSLVVELFGSDLDPLGRASAIAQGVEDRFVFSGRLSHDAVAGEMSRSQLLLLIHGCTDECIEYIPAKTFKYFLARRPILACTFRNPELDALVLERNGYVAASDHPPQIANAIEHAYSDWKNAVWKPSSTPPIGADDAVQKILSRAAVAIPDAVPS
jgi:glycosyltransferase involved in cell wall biosynthesis